ncbi:unnamed protein product [Peniophora sp. CBMAI 1063]|nr:unnamed protein product [Peniophora sp. CBMAI 1063]
MSSLGVGTASSPILIDDDSDTEVEAQVLPVPHPQPQPQLELSSSTVNKRPRAPTTPRAPRAMEERRKGKKIASDTVGFQMLMRMGYEPGKGLGLELEGPSEPLAPEHRPVFNKLGLGGVHKQSPTPSSAPELEQGTNVEKPLTKKQRKLAAQAERLAQARGQLQAGPSKLKTTPRAPRAMTRPPLPDMDSIPTAPNQQDETQIDDQDATFFMQQPATFFPNSQAAMQMQMAQMGMGMGMPFFQPMFDPMLGFPMDAAFLAAHQGMAFNPNFFADPFNAPMPPSPALPTEPRAARNKAANTQKPPSPSSNAASSSKSGKEPAAVPDRSVEHIIRGITYRPSLGPIGVRIQASPDTDYSTRNGGVPGCFQYYPELTFKADPNRTIVLETMPRKLRTIDFVERWVAQFAGDDPPVKASQILLRDTKALVEFTAEAGAARAFASPRMNGNGGQPGIRAYAYLRPGEKPREPPFIQIAIASPQWKDVITPRDVLLRLSDPTRPASKLFGPEDEDVSRQLAARREKGKQKEVPQAHVEVQVNDDLEEGELVETSTAPALPAQPRAAPLSSTTPTAPKNNAKRSARMKLDNRSLGGETVASTSGANRDPVPLSTVSVQDSAAYEAALRSRIKTRALKRTRDDAFGPQPPPSRSATLPSLPPPLAPAVLPLKPAAIISSSASSSRSTSTPALTPTSATFSAPYIPSTPSTFATESASVALPSTLITMDAEAFLMDTLRDAKRQRVLPQEPREAFAFHCARRDALLSEFNAVMAKQTTATDRENKRALSAHLKEIMADLEITRKAVNEAKALVDALNATPTRTPAPPSPMAQRRVSPPSRISMSPQPGHNINNIVGDVLPTPTPGCLFPNPTDDSRAGLAVPSQVLSHCFTTTFISISDIGSLCVVRYTRFYSLHLSICTINTHSFLSLFRYVSHVLLIAL